MHGFKGADKFGQLIRNFLAVCAGNYGALVLSFFISIVLTHRLGAETFGRLAFLLTVSQVLLLVIANWTHVGFVRYGSQEFVQYGTVARTLWARFSIIVPLLALAALILVMARGRLSNYLGVPEWGLVLVFGHFLLVCIENSLGAVFQARHEMVQYGVILFFEKAISLGLIMLTPSSWISQPLTVIGCYAMSSLLLSVWAAAVLGRTMFLPMGFDSTASRMLMGFSLPLALMSWIGVFGTNWLDLMLLKWSHSISDVGLYALAGQLAGVIQQVTIVFSTLLLPHFSIMVAGGHNEKVDMFLQRVLPYWFIAVSAVFSVALIVAGPLMSIVFGQAFQPAYPAFAVLLVASSALALYNSLDPLVVAWGRTWVLAMICIGSALVKIAVAIPMIQVWGIQGAAASTACTYWFSAVAVAVVVQRQTGVRLFRIMLLASPVAVACFAVLIMEGRDYYMIPILGTGMALYVLTNWLGLFQEADRSLFRELSMAVLRSVDATPRVKL